MPFNINQDSPKQEISYIKSLYLGQQQE